MGPGSEIKIPGRQATEGAAAKEVFDTRSNAYVVCRCYFAAALTLSADLVYSIRMYLEETYPFTVRPFFLNWT